MREATQERDLGSQLTTLDPDQTEEADLTEEADPTVLPLGLQVLLHLLVPQAKPLATPQELHLTIQATLENLQEIQETPETSLRSELPHGTELALGIELVLGIELDPRTERTDLDPERTLEMLFREEDLTLHGGPRETKSSDLTVQETVHGGQLTTQETAPGSQDPEALETVHGSLLDPDLETSPRTQDQEARTPDQELAHGGPTVLTREDPDQEMPRRPLRETAHGSPPDQEDLETAHGSLPRTD